jgi:Peptidase E
MYKFDAEWCYDSFRNERIFSDESWQSFYKKNGPFCNGLEKVFMKYGIKSESIEWINYFRDTKDTAIQNIRNADILYFCGGLPDKMMTRLGEFHIIEAVKSHSGVVMGDSAGAVIQLKQYHLTPDRDYPVFDYYQGLGFIGEFDIEVHYECTEIQYNSIKKVHKETGLPVYAMKNDGAIIVENGSIVTIGNVICYK